MRTLYRRGLALALICAVTAPAGARAGDAAPRYELTLAEALTLARSRAPAPRVAVAQTAVASARRVGAGIPLAFNPTLDLGGGPRFGPDGTSVDVEVQLGQTFELGGQRGARVDAADAGTARAEAAAEAVTNTSLREVAVAFLEARYADERLRVAADSERVAADLHRVATRRHEAGDTGGLDVSLAALALSRTRAARVTVEADRDRALGQLRSLLGVEPDAVVIPTGPLLEGRRYALSELLERVSDRPDLRALDAAARQADAEARLADARSWPDLGIRVGYGREEDADLVQAGVTLTLPIFDHGQGDEAEARATATAARLERETRDVAAASAVRAAHAAYERLLGAAERFAAEGLPLVEECEALARRSYEIGGMQLGGLLAVRRELVDARMTDADLRLRAALAAVALEAEAGGLR